MPQETEKNIGIQTSTPKFESENMVLEPSTSSKAAALRGTKIQEQQQQERALQNTMAVFIPAIITIFVSIIIAIVEIEERSWEE